MTSVLQQVLWLLKQAGKSSKDYAAYCIDNPSETCGDVWDWIKHNKLTCFLIASGILVIVVPVAIGFGPAGPIAGSIAAGWQSGIGNVVAGSVFATLQSLTMTGVLTGIGGWIIGAGIFRYLASNWGPSIAILVGNESGEDTISVQGAIGATFSLFHEKVRKLHTSIPRSSASDIEIAQLVRERREADKTLTTLELAKTKLASLWSNSDKAARGANKDAGAERRSIAGLYCRHYDLEKRLDAALATMTPASEENICQLMKELKEVNSEIAAAKLPQPGVSPVSCGLDESKTDESDTSKSNPHHLPTSSSSTTNKMSQLMEDLQIANDEIAALKLKLADTSRPSPSDDKECSTSIASTSYGSPGSTRAPPSVVIIEPPRCQKNGYDTVAAEYKGRLKKKPGLRARLLQEGRCLHCRQPGAPHTY